MIHQHVSQSGSECNIVGDNFLVWRETYIFSSSIPTIKTYIKKV